MEIRDKNLLIAIGDSWTQGVGNYDPELLDETGKPLSHISEYDVYVKSESRFKEHSWPALCAKVLDYDVINLGGGGFSNSRCAKTLLDNDSYVDLKNQYNRVVVIFLVSDPYRFSFYSNGGLKSYGIRAPVVKNDKLNMHVWDETCGLETFMQWYVTNLDIDDASKETAFYLRTVEYFCMAHGYDFYWGTAFTPLHEITKHYSNLNGCLHYNHFSSFREYMFDKLGSRAFSYCHHPNTHGYHLIAKFITTQIAKEKS